MPESTASSRLVIRNHMTFWRNLAPSKAPTAERRVLWEERPDAAPGAAKISFLPSAPHSWLAVGYTTSPLRGFSSPELLS